MNKYLNFLLKCILWACLFGVMHFFLGLELFLTKDFGKTMGFVMAVSTFSFVDGLLEDCTKTN